MHIYVKKKLTGRSCSLFRYSETKKQNPKRGPQNSEMPFKAFTWVISFKNCEGIFGVWEPQQGENIFSTIDYKPTVPLLKISQTSGYLFLKTWTTPFFQNLDNILYNVIFIFKV